MNATTLAHGLIARGAADIQLCVAASRQEREAAFELTYRAYRSVGLCQPDATELRFTPYQLLPTTDILFARLRGEVICTLSLVRDGELGLPMEDLYAEQVEERRAAGLRLAEVSCLADRRDDPKRFFELFCELSRLMVQLAEKHEVDQLLIAVHPRHVALYKRYMAFQKIGDRRDYAAVDGSPAVPLCLDLNEVRANRPASWEKFFGERIPESFLQSHPISRVDREYFLSLLESDSGPAVEDEPPFYQDEAVALIGDAFSSQKEMLCA